MSREILDSDVVGRVVAEVLGDSSRLRAAYVFGSTVSGDARPGSDLDVGLLFDGAVDHDSLIEIEARLQEATGRETDVVNLGSADPFLALDVIRGERVLCREQPECDEFELYVLRRAGDLAHFERERRSTLLDIRS